MLDKKWQQLRIDNEGEALWETFHENSKVSRFDTPLTAEEILFLMDDLWSAFPYSEQPCIELPEKYPHLEMSVGDVINKRITARNIQAKKISLPELTSILFASYGVTRDNSEGEYSRSFRTIPSGGAMFPLEVYFYTENVEGLEAGVYHYNSENHNLRLMSKGNFSRDIAKMLTQPELAVNSTLIVFITAVFPRSTMKYGNRGYRFALLEAGHLSQNLDLATISLGLGATSIGGFYDRVADDFLKLDGVMHSVVYMKAIGSHS